MREIILVLFFLVVNFQLFSQSAEMNELIDEIKIYRAKTISKKFDSEEIKSFNDSLRARVKEYLSLDKSFNHKLDSVPYLADLYSPDKSFRIITWNIGKEDLTNEYFAFIQKKNVEKKKVNYSVVELIDQSAKQFRTVEYKSFTYKNWYGALYYQIVPFKHKKKDHFVLLGWDGNNKISNKKIIEVLHFDKKGNPRFGAMVFKSEKRVKKRVVIEYTKDATISLRYHPDKKMIIYDHLAPMKPELEGLYEFYAPDLSYDGYRLKSGLWELREAIDIFNDKVEGEKYNDPRLIKEPIKKE